MNINKVNNYINPLSKAYCDYGNYFTKGFVEKDKQAYITTENLEFYEQSSHLLNFFLSYWTKTAVSKTRIEVVTEADGVFDDLFLAPQLFHTQD